MSRIMAGLLANQNEQSVPSGKSLDLLRSFRFFLHHAANPTHTGHDISCFSPRAAVPRHVLAAGQPAINRGRVMLA